MKNPIPKGTLTNVISFAKAHKVGTAILVAVFLGVAWWGYSSLSASDGQTRYVVAAAELGTIVVSVSASGQVSASNQVEVSSEVSGKVTSVPVKAGQKVGAGTLIAQLDPGDARFDLETAQLEYDELINVDSSDLRDAENAVTNATDDLEDAYTSARASLTSASTDMSDVLAGLDDLLSGSGYLNPNQQGRSNTEKDYVERAEESYYDADTLLKALIKKYRTVSSQTPRDEIEAMVTESYDVAIAVAQAAKYGQDAVVYARDRENNESAAADDAYTSVTELVSTANSVVSSLSSAKNSITTSKRDLENAKNDLSDLKDGPDALDLRSAQLNVRQKQEALADYSIRAPFAGTIASLDVKVGNTVSNNTAIATLITDQKLAEVSLNEVDAAKVQVGNKVTLTFDAIEDLTLTGQVAEVATLGEVEQGVVSYTVKIGFDSQDERIKSGMTVNATIQTDTKTDVLVVPASAIKTQNGTTYVQMFDPPLEDTVGNQGAVSDMSPQSIPVEIGLSDDTNTEIISGLEEGQQVVVRTVVASATTAATQSAPSLLGGGGMRVQTR